MASSTTSCPHISHLTPPRPDQIVHRDECTQCFDNQDGANGVNVCLSCFNGSCEDMTDPLHNHSAVHYKATSHPVLLNVRRVAKIRAEDTEPPKKLTKLEIVAEEPESEKYDFHTAVHCLQCQTSIPPDQGNLSEIIRAVLSAQTMARQSDIQAFSFDLRPCEHVLLLQQFPNTLSPNASSSRLSHCTSCDLTANLWLCLACGNVACGRTQFGGEGLPGNGHALQHYTETKHPVSVKLGSITAEGNADVYCYEHDEEIVDPELARHLGNWGIVLEDVVVTEKSLAEMQLDLQYKYSFNMSTSTGEPLQPVFGPGLTGLQNLGNSCYVSSIIQALFSIPEWQNRYSTAFELHPHECPLPYPSDGKATCLECQMSKLANGLLSGRYSTKHTTLHPDGATEDYQPGISPRMLKSLIGAGHAEFAGMKQQDAQEFLIWLVSRVQRMGRPVGRVLERLEGEEERAGGGERGWGGYVDPTRGFKFAVQQRIQCLGCGGVKYRIDEQDNINIAVPERLKRPTLEQEALSTPPPESPEYEPVDFEDCIKTFTAKTQIELTCTQCHHPHATLSNGFLTLPDVLIITASRFVLKNWVPTKLDVPLVTPETPISFDRYLVPRGLQPGETALPEDTTPVENLPPLNPASYAQLQEMGFSGVRAEKALRMTGNGSAEEAMQWLFQHLEDDDIDVPFAASRTAAATEAAVVDVESLNNLMGMGFEEAHARKALQETGGNMERAVDWLFSHPSEEAMMETDTFDTNANAMPVTPDQKVSGHDGGPANYKLQSVVMHKGASVHAGHYVAFIYKEIPGVGDDWVLFNDEKVVRGGDWNEVYKTGYVYFFRRV